MKTEVKYDKIKLISVEKLIMGILKMWICGAQLANEATTPVMKVCILYC